MKALSKHQHDRPAHKKTGVKDSTLLHTTHPLLWCPTTLCHRPRPMGLLWLPWPKAGPWSGIQTGLREARKSRLETVLPLLMSRSSHLSQKALATCSKCNGPHVLHHWPRSMPVCESTRTATIHVQKKAELRRNAGRQHLCYQVVSQLAKACLTHPLATIKGMTLSVDVLHQQPLPRPCPGPVARGLCSGCA